MKYFNSFIDDPFGEENYEKIDRKKYFIKQNMFWVSGGIEKSIMYNLSLKNAIEICERYNRVYDAFASYTYHLMEGNIQNEYSM